MTPSFTIIALAFTVTFFAGFTKGVSGLALPLVMMTALSVFLPVPLVVAMITLPALVTNIIQARSSGWMAALESLREFWILNAVLFVTTLVCTRLVVTLNEQVLLLVLGIGTACFVSIQMVGPPHVLPRAWRKPIELLAGIVAGFFGGLSGLWGTILTVYYLALRIDKEAFIRAAGSPGLRAAFRSRSATFTTGYSTGKRCHGQQPRCCPASLACGPGRWSAVTSMCGCFAES